MSREEDNAVKTDMNDLIDAKVDQKFDGYVKDHDEKDAALHERFDDLEALVVRTNGGANLKVHAILQDVVIALVAFFTFRNN